jgi:hypothetical protein
MKKIYRRETWEGLSVLIIFLLLGSSGIAIGIFSTEKKNIDDWIMCYINCPIIMISGIIIFQWWKSLTINLEDEFITMIDLDIRFGKWRPCKPRFVQIKWEDIIAVYSIRIGLKKGALVVPRANTRDSQLDKAINLEVKKDRNGKGTKAYINWLRVNKKGIEIFKEIKDYYGLLYEVCKRAPQAVIDEKIKRLLQ